MEEHIKKGNRGRSPPIHRNRPNPRRSIPRNQTEISWIPQQRGRVACRTAPISLHNKSGSGARRFYPSQRKFKVKFIHRTLFLLPRALPCSPCDGLGGWANRWMGVAPARVAGQGSNAHKKQQRTATAIPTRLGNKRLCLLLFPSHHRQSQSSHHPFKTSAV